MLGHVFCLLGDPQHDTMQLIITDDLSDSTQHVIIVAVTGYINFVTSLQNIPGKFTSDILNPGAPPLLQGPDLPLGQAVTPSIAIPQPTFHY